MTERPRIMTPWEHQRHIDEATANLQGEQLARYEAAVARDEAFWDSRPKPAAPAAEAQD